MLKKLLSAVGALALSVSIASAQTLPLPGVPGPSLGDPITNLYTLTQGVEAGSTVGVGVALSVDQTVGQSNCTQLGTVNRVHNIATSASTGYVCLPPAILGFEKVIANQTTQTIDIYGGGTGNQAVPGTQDTINGTTGSTPFTGLGSHATAFCVVVKTGAWNCGVPSSNVTGAGSFTTLTASSTVTLSPASANVVLSPTGSGVVTINPATLGTLDNVTVGGTTPAAVHATTLSTTSTTSLGALTQLGSTTPVHLAAGQTTPPTLTTCGTGAVVGNATDTAGEVHATGATACTVAWTGTFTSQPYCVATDNTTAAGLKIAYNTTVSFTVSGLTSGDTFSYMCIGQAGG